MSNAAALRLGAVRTRHARSQDNIRQEKTEQPVSVFPSPSFSPSLLPFLPSSLPPSFPLSLPPSHTHAPTNEHTHPRIHARTHAPTHAPTHPPTHRPTHPPTWSACFPSCDLCSRRASALAVNCCMLLSAAVSLSEIETQPSSRPATYPSNPSKRSLRRSKLFWKQALRL